MNIRLFHLASTFLRLVNRSLNIFLRCRRFMQRNRLRDWPPFWFTAQPRSLGYLQHDRRDLILSTACSSRANFYAQSSVPNVLVCNRLRNRRILPWLPDFCRRAYRPFFSLRAIVLRNELFAAMKRGDIRRVCQIIAAKLAGVYTRFWSWSTRFVYFGHVPNFCETQARFSSRFETKCVEKIKLNDIIKW